MPPTRFRSLLVVAALALACLLPQSAGLVASAGTGAQWLPSASHPYSDPLWLPLRKPARVSCTYSNPGCSGYHGYWAIDFLGQLGDPVHAAGAGTFRVGAVVPPGCHPAGLDSPGTWAWVDHGGGVVTKYNHLQSITVADGQLVTPATQIGTMGHEENEPCTANYLHFEVRTGGVTGPRIDPGTLFGCSGSTRQSFPGAWGEASWNDLPKAQLWTPALDNTCMPSTTGTTTPPAPLSSTRGDGTVTIAWTRPSGPTVDRYTISSEVWGPSISAWHSMSYRTVPGDQLATTFRGLDNGRTYRYRVSGHSASGNSAWTAHVKGIPAAAPLAPATDRNLSAGRAYVRFGWYGAVTRGEPVTAYTVGVRWWTGTAWSPWSFTRSTTDLTYRWDGLRSGTTYQVTVRAHSAAGSSPWGTYRKITTMA